MQRRIFRKSSSRQASVALMSPVGMAKVFVGQTWMLKILIIVLSIILMSMTSAKPNELEATSPKIGDHADVLEDPRRRSVECTSDDSGKAVCPAVCFPYDGICEHSSRSKASHCTCTRKLVLENPCETHAEEQTNDKGNCACEKLCNEDRTGRCSNNKCECSMSATSFRMVQLAKLHERGPNAILCQQGNIYEHACPDHMVGYCLPPSHAALKVPLQYYCLMAGVQWSGFITLTEVNERFVPEDISRAEQLEKPESAWNSCAVYYGAGDEQDCVKECPNGTTGHCTGGDLTPNQMPHCVCIFPPVGKNLPEIMTLPVAKKHFEKHFSMKKALRKVGTKIRSSSSKVKTWVKSMRVGQVLTSRT